MKAQAIVEKLDPDKLLASNETIAIDILERSIKIIFLDEDIDKRILYDTQNKIQLTLQHFEEENYVFHFLTENLTKHENIELLERIMQIFIGLSREKYIHDYLVSVLKSQNLKLKTAIYFVGRCYPIPRIVQSHEFRNSIVDYINSKDFRLEYQRRKKLPIWHSVIYAFPVTYIRAFQIGDFDEDMKGDISKNKMSKVVTQMRLESIRMIDDNELKIILIRLYHSQYLAHTL